MASVNKAIIVGNLGRDPEMRAMPSGDQIANFSVATTETWKDKAGEKQEKTEWHRVVAFGKLAEICGRYLAKGKQVYVEGKIQTREWEDKDGNRRWTTEIVAREMRMLGSRSESDAPQESRGYAEDRPEPSRRPDPKPAPDYDDDIPF